MVTTEICVFTLLDTITLPDLLDPSSVHKSSIATVRSQPGCQSFHWGVGIQDPLKLFWFIEWDSLSSHQLFQSHPSYPSFASTLITTLTNPSSESPISVLHYNLPTPLSAFPPSPKKPYLEYFSLPTLPSSNSSISSTFETLKTALSTYDPEEGKAIPSTYAFSIDEGHENLVVSLIGWKDKDQHAAFLKTDAFAKAEPEMRQVAAGPPTAIHVDLQEWE
ncbi:hypothetical protein TWF225_004099 [Orbilia oligospora]|nr:hypothetical protein TWF225_004099 [Orbilia oligospora]KAF3248159.1 hypothetical protein TWF128_008506 [Orbilia oligospora]KAF3257767.1 hypothetical protein TWF217_005876 [Orbilia oligospora]KAF3283988.1 hypothetical protein TWF132_009881 [Orbilia oligospora]